MGERQTGSEGGVGLADEKYRLGLRLGYALPFGDTDNRNKLSTPFPGQVPIWVDAGYMLIPRVLVGLYGQYGFVRTRGYCWSGCSAHDIRFGVQAQYHLMPTASADPWLGLGVGYEVLGSSRSVTEADNLRRTSSNTTGFEFLNLQAGADFKVAKPFTLGPFVSLSIGKYWSESVDGKSVDFPEPGSSTSLHEWLAFGAKGTFAL